MKTIKQLLILTAAVFTANGVMAQASPGEIQGRVYEKPGEINEGALVWVEVNGEKLKTLVDEEGRFILKPLNAGTYIVYIKAMDRMDTVKRKAEVLSNEITKLRNVVLSEEAKELDEAVVQGEPLIRIDQPAVVKMNAKQLDHVPYKRDVKQLLAVMTSDVKTFNGQNYIRGSRADAVLYIIDGVKQSDKVINVPGSAVNSVMVYTGGIPAKYGDCTGGAVIVETKSYFTLYYEWLANQ